MTASEAPETFEGRVVEVASSYSRVVTDDGEEVLCHLKGTLRAAAGGEGIRNPVAVGDRVRAIRSTVEGEGVIEEVLPRRTQLLKRASGEPDLGQVVIANVDRILIVVATKKPKYKAGFIDRMLVAAHNGGLDPTIVVNKMDLLKTMKRQKVEQELELYREIGYPVIFSSVETAEGVDEVREALHGHISVVAGPSGVGKSSLLNAIQPGLALRTGEVSERWKKGRHTTTAVKLLPLDRGGFVADTPGVRAFGLWDIEPRYLGRGFAEFRHYLGACKFGDCLHTAEPGCAVKQAVEEGAISQRRYESYTRILESVAEEAREKWQ